MGKGEVYASQKTAYIPTNSSHYFLPLHLAVQVTANVDPDLRRRVRSHHTATHLLQSALKRVLGPDTCQQGSQLDAEHLRISIAPVPVTLSEHHHTSAKWPCRTSCSHVEIC
eukprot:1160088-Pelagomonas_calceolata.AAC.4